MKRKSMKKLSLFVFAFAAALVMTGCSDETGALTETGTGSSSTGGGYMSVTINLPTTTSTRAATYTNGLDEEFDVKTVKLLLFGGSDEASATCQGVYDLSGTWELDADDQVTSEATFVTEVKGLTGSNYYMMAVLNDNGLVTSATMIGKTLTDLTTTAQQWDVDDLIADGFFMTNAPINANAGGTGNVPTVDVQTLVKFDSDKIKSTEAAATADPAGEIYVERAMSKVTVSSSASGAAVSDTEILSYSIEGWTLDNTNTYTYFVRNVDDLSTWAPYVTGTNFYRFVENSEIESGAGYRINFATDPNYDVACDGTETYPLKKLTADELAATTLTSVGSTPMYCLENTFDVAHMLWQNTTSVIVAAKLDVSSADSDGTFYVINGINDLVYTSEGAANYAASLWAKYFDTVADQYITKGSISDITATLDVANGYATVESVSFTPSTGIEYVTGQDSTTIQTAAVTYLNGLISAGTLTLACYENGISYYSVRIKHFGDDDTPWDSSMESAGNSYPEGYNSQTAENNWLGRYGMVRNTWYSIDVTGIKQIGSPTVPDINVDKYDDQVPSYIACNINILAWAVRSQSALLE